MNEHDITICGHGSGNPSLKKLDEYATTRYNKKATNGKHKGIIAVRRLKELNDLGRNKFHDAYKSILGKNIYSQAKRSYVFTKYKDGHYYSDCSSSGCACLKQAGYNVALYNTAGIFSSDLFESVDVNIVNGHITNPEVLKVGDAILFVGDDPKRPLQIGHVEWVYEIKAQPNPSPKKEVYKGEFPKLPKRGFFRNKDVDNEVKKLKAFLNWFDSKYKLNEKNPNYFGSTEACVIDFQKRNGLVADGEFGSKSLAKAKTIKK